MLFPILKCHLYKPAVKRHYLGPADEATKQFLSGGYRVVRFSNTGRGASNRTFGEAGKMQRVFALVARFVLATLIVVLLPMVRAEADGWPSRPITIVVPYAAGGNVDIAARLFAKALSEKLGQSVIIEDKPGAGGIVGSVTVANATPDGYTLLLTAAGPGALNKLLYKSLPYDADTQFTPIVVTNDVPQVVVIDPKLPVANLNELVAYSKQKKSVSIGHAGPGTMGQLAALLLVAQTKMNAVLVSYRGSAPLITDLLGGQIEAGVPAYIPEVNTVKAIAVTTESRVSFLPQVPTTRESGIADVEAATWNALLGPAGLPPEIVDKLNASVNAYLKTEAAQQDLARLGARPIGGSPADVTKLIADERAKWAPIIQSAHISLDQ
jgi:tripartite-type tricarboxylate transporter receptor subunit TctC